MKSKRNEIYRNETKYKSKRNSSKRNEIYRNENGSISLNRNEIHRNETKFPVEAGVTVLFDSFLQNIRKCYDIEIYVF
jgi:hypothetical protein